LPARTAVQDPFQTLAERYGAGERSSVVTPEIRATVTAVPVAVTRIIDPRIP